MSASSEIRFKIGADTSALSRGFGEAQSIAAVAGKQIQKKLGLQDAFKSTVLALGLSIEKISEKIAEMFTGGAQESWKAALESAKEAERIIEETTLRRMSTLRQIEQLEKEIERNRANESAAPKKTGELGMARRVLDAVGENMASVGAKFFNAIGAKTAGASWGRTAEIFRQRGDETGEGVESPAEALARSQKAQAENLARQAKADELKEKRNPDQERVDQAFLDLARLSMTEQEKALELQQETEMAEEKLNEARRKGAETTELEIDLLHKQKALEEQLLKIEKDQTAEEKKKADEREQFLEKYRRYLEAQNGVQEAGKAAADARHDAVAFSIDDAASGKRGASRDRSRARAIQLDEARARRLFDSGLSVDEVSPDGRRSVKRDFSFFQNRAEQMRKGFDRAKTDEQNPFKGVDERLIEANKHLTEMERALKPVKV